MFFAEQTESVLLQSRVGVSIAVTCKHRDARCDAEVTPARARRRRAAPSKGQNPKHRATRRMCALNSRKRIKDEVKSNMEETTRSLGQVNGLILM